MLEEARTNPRAFAPVYEHHFPGIYRYCLRRVGSKEDAEDLASLVFTRALASLNAYRGGSVAAWLFQIAHNIVANYLRDRHPIVAFDDTGQQGWELVASDENTLDRLVEAEELARVATLIAKLPDDQRDLLALRIAGRLSAREIGQVVGKNEGAIRVALHRITQSLQAGYRRGDTEELT